MYIFTVFVRLSLPRERRINEERKLALSQQIHLGFVRGMSEGPMQWQQNSATVAQPNDKRENYGDSVLHRSRGKFIFAFRYYEQLGRATENLLAFCSLAKYGNREVVAPFVNNSRMAGTPYGVGHRYRRKRTMSFSPFETY